MNKLKPNLPLSDLEEDQRELPLISPEESQLLPNGEPSDVPRTNGDPPSELPSPPAPLCINNNTTSVSQAYGGARPKTIRARLRNANSEVTSSSSSSRGRQSESSVGVEIRVISCDNSNGGGGGETSILPHQDISNVPRLETRPTAPARAELEVEQSENVTEDDCYIYTYIGGTAYLSADLPNSFFR